MPLAGHEGRRYKNDKGEKSLSNIVDECKNYVVYMAMNAGEAEPKT